MSSLSRPTSSSSAPPSPFPVLPSSSSSLLSLSLSSGSSMIDSLSVGATDVSHPVEVVWGDDSANDFDRSDSPKQVVSLVEFGWVDLKVTGIASPSRPRPLSPSFWRSSRF